MIRLYRYVYRSAIDGRFVSEEYARANPETTFRQRVWRWQRGFK